MTALQRTTDDFGYGPARAARLESDHAMRRALPSSFVLVTGILLALAIVQRLLPGSAIVVEGGRVNEHWMIPPGRVPPPSEQPVLRAVPAAANTVHVPVPVPDIAAPPADAANRGIVGSGDGPVATAGGAEAGAGGGVTLAPYPLPGVFVYADQLPERIFFVSPEYTDMAREAGVEGIVMLWALVDLDGSVKAVQVIRSVPLLDAAASAAVHRWRFTPALANGHPVRVWVAVPVKFSLR